MASRVPRMSFVRNILDWLREIGRAPGVSKSRLRALLRALRWKAGITVGYRRALLTIGPARFYCYPGYASASGLVCYGFLEWDETAFTVRFLREGDLFLDIGANIGTFSVVAGAFVPGIKIISVEPGDEARGLLIENLSLSGLSTDSVSEKVVGETVGEVRFTVGLDVLNAIATDDSAETVTLEQTTVDELAGGQALSLMKVDVEGVELSVFKGAAEQLALRPGPVILFEINGFCQKYGVEPAEIIDFLAAAGYRVYEYNGVAGELTEYTDRGIPPSHNLVATTDIDMVRQRLDSAEPPVDLLDLPVRIKFQR